jgi:hypothetical protein
MTVEEKDATVVVTNTKDALSDYVANIAGQFSAPQRHLVVNIPLDIQFLNKEAKLFLPLAKSYKKCKKSFIVVAPHANFSTMPEALVVVPSMVEAFDVIEMEEIERDLGL